MLLKPIANFHSDALRKYKRDRVSRDWHIFIDEDLLFDEAGLKLIHWAISDYRGWANKLDFTVRFSPEAARDFYAFHEKNIGEIELGVTAGRTQLADDPKSAAVLTVHLPETIEEIPFPILCVRQPECPCPERCCSIITMNSILCSPIRSR